MDKPKPKLLSGGNPQIPKGYGEAPVRQKEATIGPAPLAIRPAMPQYLGHRQPTLAQDGVRESIRPRHQSSG